MIWVRVVIIFLGDSLVVLRFLIRWLVMLLENSLWFVVLGGVIWKYGLVVRYFLMSFLLILVLFLVFILLLWLKCFWLFVKICMVVFMKILFGLVLNVMYVEWDVGELFEVFEVGKIVVFLILLIFWLIFVFFLLVKRVFLKNFVRGVFWWLVVSLVIWKLLMIVL